MSSVANWFLNHENFTRKHFFFGFVKGIFPDISFDIETFEGI